MTRLIALALLALTLLPTQAEARDCAEHTWRRVCDREWPVPSCWNRRICIRWEPRYEKVYGYERRQEPEDVEVRGHCLWNQPTVSATGDDKLEEEPARVSAQDRWSLTVENLRGTRYSDVRNAAHLTAACIKRAPVTWTERKQADIADIRHFVCTIEAVPCSAPKLPVEEDELAKRKVEKINEQIGRKEDPRADAYEPAPPKKRRWYWRPARRD